MKTVDLLLVAGAALAIATPVVADTINFGTFGPNGTPVPDGSVGMTVDGVNFTLTGLVKGGTRVEQPGSWAGQFVLGTPVLFTNGMGGAVTLTFASALTSLTGISAESNNGGAYTATAQYFDGATLLTTLSYNSVSNNAPGTALYFNYASSSITSVVFSTTNDGVGLGLAGALGTVPEPSSWAMLIAGFGLAGAVMRRRRSAAVAA